MSSLPITFEEKRAPLLETRGLTKCFGSLVANDHIDIRLEAGEVHAVLGENGAGKSTLMKTLYGVHLQDEGTIYVDGKPVELHPPANARSLGISMVFQDFRLIAALTVLENIAITLNQNGFFLRRSKLKDKIRHVAEKYKIEIDPDAYVWQLDQGQRQRVEIIKVLILDTTRIIIFDEPTSVLTPHEVDAFLDMIRKLRDDGYGILLITHKINEVVACADRVTVLRAGKATFSTDKVIGFRQDELIQQMMGQTYSFEKPAREQRAGAQETVLTISNMTITDERGRDVLRNIDLTVRAGEIIGIAGISGNGQREMMETLFGLRKPKDGSLFLGERNLTSSPPKQFMDAGVSYIPEDPSQESIVGGFTVLQHMALGGLHLVNKGWGIDWPRMREQMMEFSEMAALGVAAPERKASQLSGGNVQRMVLARAMITGPKLLLVSYPSKGLDLGTTHSVHELLYALRDKGTAIIFLSEDLNELFRLSDRIAVAANQSLQGPFDPDVTDPYEIGHIMLKGG